MEYEVKQDNFPEENIRAEEAITAGDLPDAARILTELVKKDPGNWRAYNSMGIIAWIRNCWLDAYTMFLQSVTLNPGYSDALMNLFDAALKLKRVNKIMPCFEAAINEHNNQDKDIKVIRNSIKELGEDIYFTPRALSIGVYDPIIDEACKHMDDGNLNSALNKFQESLTKNGPNAAAYCGIGIIAYYRKNYQDSFSFFTESIKLNPLDHDTWMNLLDTAKEAGMEIDAYALFSNYRADFQELAPLETEFEKLQSENEQ